MKAGKWNKDKEEYDPCELPKGAALYETDMDKEVNCANCGKLMQFGNGYTSRKIHTRTGLGYCVCDSCYWKEW